MISKRMQERVAALLAAELQEGERIESAVYGDGLDDDVLGGPAVGVALTDRRVIAIAKYRLKCTRASWNFHQITAVATGSGLLTGRLVFTVPGDQFVAKGFAKREAEQFRHDVEHRLHASEAPSLDAASERSTSAAERMRHLDDLKSTGLITEAEYVEKRAEILAAL